MANRSTIKIRSKWQKKRLLIRILISHPMETGKNKDKITGELIPEHFIQILIFKHNDKVMCECQMGVGISKNPFFSFRLKAAEIGDIVTISWKDNLGRYDSKEHVIQ